MYKTIEYTRKFFERKTQFLSTILGQHLTYMHNASSGPPSWSKMLCNQALITKRAGKMAPGWCCAVRLVQDESMAESINITILYLVASWSW